MKHDKYKIPGLKEISKKMPKLFNMINKNNKPSIEPLPEVYKQSLKLFRNKLYNRLYHNHRRIIE